MEYERLIRSSHGVSQNTYHFVWCTKCRHPVFKSEGYKKVCADFIRRSAKRHSIEIFECRVLPEHVHAFVRLPRTMSIDKAFQLLKGSSSYLLRRYNPYLRKYKALWSKFTFSRTVGSVTGNVIEHYIKEANSKGLYGNQTNLMTYN